MPHQIYLQVIWRINKQQCSKRT